jgi:hypothetical protein
MLAYSIPSMRKIPAVQTVGRDSYFYLLKSTKSIFDIIKEYFTWKINKASWRKTSIRRKNITEAPLNKQIINTEAFYNKQNSKIEGQVIC